MIKLDIGDAEGNVQVGITRHIDEASQLPDGKYTVFAHYNGYRGDSEDIKTALRELTQPGEWGLADKRDVDHELAAKEINDMVAKVRELTRVKDYGLVVSEIDEDRNGEVAKLLEERYGYKLTEEGHVTPETKKGFSHTIEEPVSRV